MFAAIRELDRSESVRRKAKILRNLITDPMPRNQELVLESYRIDHPKILYTFRTADAKYTSEVDFGDVSREEVERIDSDTLRRVAVTIGLALVPLHFYLTDFASVRIECGDFLDGAAVEFLEKFLRCGLAEFRFRHGLDPTRNIRLITGYTSRAATPRTASASDRILLLNGGGKDTAVMAELAKATDLPLAWCSVNPTPRHQSVADASGIAENCQVRFKVDPAIKNNARYRWGHVPYAAVYMSASLLAAVGRGYRYVGIGNEYSSSFGNVRYKDVELNHQYSKSYEYETAFQRYLEMYVLKGITYCSLLRPFHDLRIATMLSRMPQYFGTFVSCNLSSGWCGECPKCAFTYLALMPWLSKDDLAHTFEADFLRTPAIRKHILELTAGRLKPWECVGTQDECRLALALVLRQHPEMNFPERPTRKDLVAACGNTDMNGAVERLLRRSHEPHAIPAALWGRIAARADRLTNEALTNARLDG